MGPDARYCVNKVRSGDSDRYLATLYAPASVRPALFALHALDIEMASVVRTTTEPMLGEIRLAWWREALQQLDATKIPAQPVLRAIAAELLPRGIRGSSLELLEDGYLALLSGSAFETAENALAYAETRGATLFGAALQLLAPTAADSAVEVVRQAGAAWALADLARYPDAPPLFRALAEESLRTIQAGAGTVPAAARPLLALLRLARLDLAAGRRIGRVARQAQLLWGVISGRP